MCSGEHLQYKIPSIWRALLYDQRNQREMVLPEIDHNASAMQKYMSQYSSTTKQKRSRSIAPQTVEVEHSNTDDAKRFTASETSCFI